MLQLECQPVGDHLRRNSLEALDQDLSLDVVQRGQGTECVVVTVQDSRLALPNEGLGGFYAHLSADLEWQKGHLEEVPLEKVLVHHVANLLREDLEVALVHVESDLWYACMEYVCSGCSGC